MLKILAKSQRNRKSLVNYAPSVAFNLHALGSRTSGARQMRNAAQALTAKATAFINDRQIDSRQVAMATISATVAGRYRQVQRDRPEWFWHLLERCETKAARIAAARAEYSHGDATYIEAFANTLPLLFRQAMQRLDHFVAESSGRQAS
jgi:hypothetical protein